MGTVKVNIDDQEYLADSQETILEIAERNGIFIPTLCYDPRLKPYGACRLCLVEVEGARGLMASCGTTASDGMVVRTQTPALLRLRRSILELLLSDHPLDCLVCDKAGECRLQDLAYAYGIRESRFVGETHSYQLQPDKEPFILRDKEKCILCGRCVRICDEVMNLGAIDFAYRGFDTMIQTAFDVPLQESPCVFCGNCISSCPVGSLYPKDRVGKGRSWELQATKTVCPYCGCGCQYYLHSKDNQVVGVDTVPGEGLNKGNLCAKGRFAIEFINHPDRLTRPLVRKDGEFMEVEWDQALDVVAQGISAIVDKYGPDSFAGLSSAKCTNEENYLFQKFMRAVVGTNNVDHCARL